MGAAPLKLKPMTENIDRMSGSLAKICSALRAIAPVYCSDDPAGACTCVRKYPWSSSGRNDRGTLAVTQ